MTQFPAPSYAKAVLTPIFEHMKENMFDALMELNDAHAIMLEEQGLLSEKECITILQSLQKIIKADIQKVEYDGSVEDLFFYIENLLIEDLGEEIAGKLHTARSRNDMYLTIYRMVLREKILRLFTQLNAFEKTLIQLIETHKETIMTGYTHTQPAQATTLGHYLLALLDVVQRDAERFQALYARVNRSPMGAAAITTTGFPINRERVQELLGFQDLVENSYDAIAGGDYITEAASVLAIFSLNLGRFVQDFLQWATVEFSSIRVGDAYVQISSIMPQKRNPVSLEHSRALLSGVYGEAQAVIAMIHNTPFGDIVDTEDDMQPHLWHAYDRATGIVELLSGVLESITVDKERLKDRVKENFSTVTELADTLVREYGFSFRTAHRIVSKVSKECYKNQWKADQITLAMIEQAAFEVTGKSTSFHPNLLQSLDPDHFVQLRSIVGGPAPVEVSRMLQLRQQKAEKALQWLKGEQIALETAASKRKHCIDHYIGRKEGV